MAGREQQNFPNDDDDNSSNQIAEDGNGSQQSPQSMSLIEEIEHDMIEIIKSLRDLFSDFDRNEFEYESEYQQVLDSIRCLNSENSEIRMVDVDVILSNLSNNGPLFEELIYEPNTVLTPATQAYILLFNRLHTGVKAAQEKMKNYLNGSFHCKKEIMNWASKFLHDTDVFLNDGRGAISNLPQPLPYLEQGADDQFEQAEENQNFGALSESDKNVLLYTLKNLKAGLTEMINEIRQNNRNNNQVDLSSASTTTMRRPIDEENEYLSPIVQNEIVTNEVQDDVVLEELAENEDSDEVKLPDPCHFTGRKVVEIKIKEGFTKWNPKTSFLEIDQNQKQSKGPVYDVSELLLPIVEEDEVENEAEFEVDEVEVVQCPSDILEFDSPEIFHLPPTVFEKIGQNDLSKINDDLILSIGSSHHHSRPNSNDKISSKPRLAICFDVDPQKSEDIIKVDDNKSKGLIDFERHQSLKIWAKESLQVIVRIMKDRVSSTLLDIKSQVNLDKCSHMKIINGLDHTIDCVNNVINLFRNIQQDDGSSTPKSTIKMSSCPALICSSGIKSKNFEKVINQVEIEQEISQIRIDGLKNFANSHQEMKSSDCSSKIMSRNFEKICSKKSLTDCESKNAVLSILDLVINQVLYDTDDKTEEFHSNLSILSGSVKSFENFDKIDENKSSKGSISPGSTLKNEVSSKILKILNQMDYDDFDKEKEINRKELLEKLYELTNGYFLVIQLLRKSKFLSTEDILSSQNSQNDEEVLSKSVIIEHYKGIFSSLRKQIDILKKNEENFDQETPSTTSTSSQLETNSSDSLKSECSQILELISGSKFQDCEENDTEENDIIESINLTNSTKKFEKESEKSVLELQTEIISKVEITNQMVDQYQGQENSHKMNDLEKTEMTKEVKSTSKKPSSFRISPRLAFCFNQDQIIPQTSSRINIIPQSQDLVISKRTQNVNENGSSNCTRKISDLINIESSHDAICKTNISLNCSKNDQDCISSSQNFETNASNRQSQEIHDINDNSHDILTRSSNGSSKFQDINDIENFQKIISRPSEESIESTVILISSEETTSKFLKRILQQDSDENDQINDNWMVDVPSKSSQLLKACAANFKSQSPTLVTVDVESKSVINEGDFESEIEISEADFESEIEISEADFESEIEISEADFESEIEIPEVDFESEIEIPEVDIEPKIVIPEAGQISNPIQYLFSPENNTFNNIFGILPPAGYHGDIVQGKPESQQILKNREKPSITPKITQISQVPGQVLHQYQGKIPSYSTRGLHSNSFPSQTQENHQNFGDKMKNSKIPLPLGKTINKDGQSGQSYLVPKSHKH